jgi:Fibronectin type III domain
LQWIYGTLNPRNNGTLGGSLVQFDQTEFIASGHGMDTSGWLFVPAACAAGQQCRLHVALHGCLQSYSSVGAAFLNNTGYNRWGDTNNIIVLYPQAIADNTIHATAASGSLPNPNGCWDWIGWYGTDFDQKTGVQAKAIMAMVDRIIKAQSSGSGGTVPPTPTNLAVTGTTSNSITLSWTASAGATRYNVYRDDGKVQSTAATLFTDGGLAPSTTHSYSVSAVNSAGESARSGTVTGTTSAVPYSEQVTDTALGHYLAGRITVAQYVQLGQEYGYLTPFTLYLCGSTWTNSPTCGPLH